MPNITDREYLLTGQYRDASNLNARSQLHECFSVNRYGWHRWIFDQFQLSPESRILELGCGPGGLWGPNVGRISPGWAVTLSDFSPGMVQEARSNLQASQRHFEYAVIGAQSLPFGDASHDVVIANHMLYHVPDRARALAEIRRILKPGGRFYASTIGTTHMQELDDLVCRFAGRSDPAGEDLCEAFALENGLDQIAQWFSGVTLCRYEDALVVTEAAPLVAYILSSNTWWSTPIHDRKAELARFVEQELALHGAIRVTKDSGLFTAFRDNAP
jgi:ubiquinone/menaquinone biosynthesis C-methylase UbiE